MKIFKILNNNTVIILDENNREKIIGGTGIAYSKKIGDTIEKDKINQTFIMQSDDMSSKLQQLISDIPLEYITLSADIVEYAEVTMGKKLSESLLVSLSDHIHSAVKRHKEGIHLQNALIWEFKRFYKMEFEIGVEALSIINKAIEVKLPIDEAAFIATHIVEAGSEQNLEQINDVAKLMHEVINFVTYFFHVELDQESVYHYRFITHLKFFAQRALIGEQYNDNDDDLLDVLKVKYPNSYKCVNRIAEYIEKNYHYIVSNEEKSYLTIHIERLIYKKK